MSVTTQNPPSTRRRTPTPTPEPTPAPAPSSPFRKWSIIVGSLVAFFIVIGALNGASTPDTSAVETAPVAALPQQAPADDVVSLADAALINDAEKACVKGNDQGAALAELQASAGNVNSATQNYLVSAYLRCVNDQADKSDRAAKRLQKQIDKLSRH